MESGEIRVTIDGQDVRTIPAEVVPVPFGRGAPIGRTENGTLYAGFSTEGPGLESVLLCSTDEGRSWSEKRLDWRQFLDHTAARDSMEFLFWEKRWAMTSDSFGILKDGTLVWAFLQNLDQLSVQGMEEACFIIRSEDGGDSWQGPVPFDKTPFPSVGCSSNRMTELPDGTVLWPQRLGLTHGEISRIEEGAQRSGQPWVGAPYAQTYVFRSTDGGLTWGERTPLPDWSFETTLLRLRSGRLIAAIRYQHPFSMDAQLPPGKRVYLADSEDDGRTWIDFRPVRRTPDGETDLVLGECHGELTELSDGTMVLTYDHRYPYEKQQVLARVSRDGGQTWMPEVHHVTVAGGSVLGSHERGVGSGYASTVALDDDTLVTMTGAGTCTRWRIS